LTVRERKEGEQLFFSVLDALYNRKIPVAIVNNPSVFWKIALSFNSCLTKTELPNAIMAIRTYENILPRLKGRTTLTDCLKVSAFLTSKGARNGIHVNMHAVLPYDTPIIKREKIGMLSIVYPFTCTSMQTYPEMYPLLSCVLFLKIVNYVLNKRLN